MNSAIFKSSARKRWCSSKRARAMAEPLRTVLMTTDTVGGVWSFTLDLAEALAAHGVQVIAAALGGRPSSDQRAAAERISNLQLFTSDFKLDWMDDPWRDVAASGRWLLELEQEHAP